MKLSAAHEQAAASVDRIPYDQRPPARASRRRADNAGDGRDDRHRHDGEPTVHVTIGRIEVRAVPGAQTAVPSRSDRPPARGVSAGTGPGKPAVSNSLAVAAVTSALRLLLESASADFPGLAVSTKHPDRARGGETGNQVNLFLYHLGHDAAWRNAELPKDRTGAPGFFPPYRARPWTIS